MFFRILVYVLDYDWFRKQIAVLRQLRCSNGSLCREIRLYLIVSNLKERQK